MVATSFKETVADDDDSEVAGNATTVAKTFFSERLLRDIEGAHFTISKVINARCLGLLFPDVVKRNLKISRKWRIISR